MQSHKVVSLRYHVVLWALEFLCVIYVYISNEDIHRILNLQRSPTLVAMFVCETNKPDGTCVCRLFLCFMALGLAEGASILQANHRSHVTLARPQCHKSRMEVRDFVGHQEFKVIFQHVKCIKMPSLCGNPWKKPASLWHLRTGNWSCAHMKAQFVVSTERCFKSWHFARWKLPWPVKPAVLLTGIVCQLLWVQRTHGILNTSYLCRQSNKKNKNKEEYIGIYWIHQSSCHVWTSSTRLSREETQNLYKQFDNQEQLHVTQIIGRHKPQPAPSNPKQANMVRGSMQFTSTNRAMSRLNPTIQTRKLCVCVFQIGSRISCQFI